MRFTAATLLLCLALALAGPVPKTSEKKSLVASTKLDKEAPKIEDIGDQKDRSKKSTTTFCVEIRPGTNEAVQTQCACKDKALPVQQSAAQQLPPQSAPQLAPQPAPQQMPQQASHPAPAPQSLNIIHSPPQPQTLNIIQPAPTLHTVHFVHPQSGPSSVQNLHILQPAAKLPEPVPQTIRIEAPTSKPEVETFKPTETAHSEAMIKPAVEPEPKPAPQPSVQPAHQPTQQVVLPTSGPESHKSEVHVSVVTEDKKKEQENKPQLVNIIHPQVRPVENIKIVPVTPVRPPTYQEQVVVVPNMPQMMVMHQPEPCQSGALIQVPQGSVYQPSGSVYQPSGSVYQPSGSLYQSSGSVYQVPGSVYQQQGGPVYTECSCKQTHPTNANVHSNVLPSSMLRTHNKNAKIMPVVVYPQPVVSAPSEGSSVSVHCNSETAAVPVATQAGDSPMIVNMQTMRSKDGNMGESSDMMRSEQMGERTVSHISLDAPAHHYHGHLHTPNVYYDVAPGLQANLYKEPALKPYYGNSHVHMEIGRQAQPTLDGSKVDDLKDGKVDSDLSAGARIVRSDKDAVTKVADKMAEEKKVEEKTSSATKSE